MGLCKMRMRRGEAAVFAVMVGFTSCMVFLAGIAVRSDGAGTGAPASPGGPAEPGQGTASGVRETDLAAGSGALEVVVKDAAGQPMPGAEVSLERASGGGTSMTRTTDRDGRCAFSGLTRRQQQVCVALAGYTTLRRAVSLSASAASGADHLEIQLHRGNQTLSGRVLDPDSSPVRGAVVQARAFDAANGVDVCFTARTTAAGSFTMEGMLDLPFEIKVSEVPSALCLEQPVTARPADGCLVLRLAPRTRGQDDRGESQVLISGRVVDKLGKGIGDVEVRLTAAGPGTHRKLARIITDRRGAFAAQVPAGSYRLTTHKADFASTIRSVEIGTQGRLAIEPVVISRGGELTATLEDGNGKPIGSVPVRVIGNDPSLNLVFRTDAEGSIRATELPAGTYLVKAAMPAGPSQQVEVRDGQKTSIVLK
ncbi:MAG: carboxypeptidase-like regulatory domain-containing protein [Planctomycetota bacterium]